MAQQTLRPHRPLSLHNGVSLENYLLYTFILHVFVNLLEKQRRFSFTYIIVNV